LRLRAKPCGLTPNLGLALGQPKSRRGGNAAAMPRTTIFDN